MSESPDPSSPARITRDPAALLGREFDVLIVGGGINGTGAAREAARRGLSVALLEKHDFGYGTTGRSTRLIHGGLRYLETFDFGLVREGLRERERLLRHAPHLVKPLPFLLPVYQGHKPGRFMLRLGLLLYDVLSFDKTLPNHTFLNARQTLAKEPKLRAEGLKGAGVYYDAQVPLVERLCVENALDACAHGAVAVNHCEVEEFLLEHGNVVGVRATDLTTGERVDVRAKVTINATGPWLTVMDLAQGRKRLRMTKGIHLVVPKCVDHGVVLFSSEDDRLFFAVPWLDRTLLGTTDTDYEGDLDQVHATDEDVRYLIASAREWMPDASLKDIGYTYAGVRSLLNVEGIPAGEVSRRHFLIDHSRQEGVGGLITIVGGKITPFRHVCEETVTLASRKLARKTRPATRKAPLPGAWAGPQGQAALAARLDAEAAHLPAPVRAHLLGVYGARAPAVAALAKQRHALSEPVCAHGPSILAEVEHAAREEGAITLGDVLLRRTIAGWEPCEARDGLAQVAQTLGETLGWNAATQAKQIEAYLAELAPRHAHRHP